MKWTFGSMFLVVAINTALAASWETTSLRTASGGLIRVGMTSQEALQELGPAAKTRGGKQTKNSKQTLSYRGEDGLYTISLAGGRVVKIVVTPDRD